MGDCLALSRKNLNFADEKEKNITKITERQKGGETNLETNNKYIRFDWAVKRMLRDKANFAVLEGLVTVLLGEKITISELLESEYGKGTRFFFTISQKKVKEKREEKEDKTNV